MSSARSLRLLLLLILATALLRLLGAAGLGLGIDESYMVASGRTLHVGYFDHPPLAWWLSRGAALLLGSEQPVVVRLPFVALFTLSTFLVWRLGTLANSPAAGLWAAVALNLSPVLGITTASWVLPDGPLDCALLGAGCCLMRALPEPRGWSWWLGAGACAGLALLSKYSAVLTLAGAALYLLTSPLHRRWLARPQPWAAAAVAAALFAPVLAWNASHGWISFAFQGGRAMAHKLNPAGPLLVLAGGALFLLPWIWAGLMAALLRGLRAGPLAWRSWLLCWLALPPIVLFAVVALWSRQVLFHWAVPGYLFLFPLLGTALARLAEARPVVLRARRRRHRGVAGRGRAGHRDGTALALAGRRRAPRPRPAGARLDPVARRVGPNAPCCTGPARSSPALPGGSPARSIMRSAATRR